VQLRPNDFATAGKNLFKKSLPAMAKCAFSTVCGTLQGGSTLEAPFALKVEPPTGFAT